MPVSRVGISRLESYSQIRNTSSRNFKNKRIIQQRMGGKKNINSGLNYFNYLMRNLRGRIKGSGEKNADKARKRRRKKKEG